MESQGIQGNIGKMNRKWVRKCMTKQDTKCCHSDWERDRQRVLEKENRGGEKTKAQGGKALRLGDETGASLKTRQEASTVNEKIRVQKQ